MIDHNNPAATPAESHPASDRHDPADPKELLRVIARANAALPDTDPRKIRPDDVAMLQRLSEQEMGVSLRMVEHASDRRGVGERRGRVSPEAGNTAEWAARLAAALESMIETPSGVPPVANAPAVRFRRKTGQTSESDEYLAHQRREFGAADGSLWRVRIEQGGGKEAADAGAAPVAVLIFQPVGNATAAELSAAEPGGKWDLGAYSVDDLRAILARARGRQRQ
jgi:hypothetical protein